MANAIEHNPFVIDTFGATVITADTLWIQAIYWNATGAGTVTVTDKDDKLIWESTLAAAGTPSLTVPRLVESHGLKVTSGNGKVFFYQPDKL